MNNEELIDALRNVYGDKADCYHCHSKVGCYGTSCIEQLCRDAADALEAADKRIDNLQQTCDKLASNLQQAQLPKEGEWLDEQRGRWIYAKCNLCGKVQDVRSNYCPNCGAMMKGEHDEQIH